MSILIKVTFKRVNGDNTGVFARPKAGDMSRNRGVLYMRNCPDGKTFYVNPNDEGNIPASNWYRIEDPSKYSLPDETLYCRLLTSYCTWEEITIEDDTDDEESDDTQNGESEGTTEEEDDYIYEQMNKTQYNTSDYTSYVNNEVWFAGNKKYTSNSLKMTDAFSDSYDMYSLSRQRR